MTRKLAWAMGPAVTLGDVKKPTPKVSSKICRKHTWINSKFNKRCSKCGLEMDKAANPPMPMIPTIPTITPKEARPQTLTPVRLSHCYTLHSYFRGFSFPYLTVGGIAREFAMTSAMVWNSIDRLMLAGAPIDFTFDNKPFYTNQDFYSDDIERHLNNKFATPGRFLPKFTNGRYFGLRQVGGRRIGILLATLEQRYGKVPVKDAMIRCGLTDQQE